MTADPPATRDRILQAAYRLFYREGFSRVSVDAIAEYAKLTKRTVYYHFNSKDDIAAAALEDLHRHLMPQFQQWAGPNTTDPDELVKNLFGEMKAWADGEWWLGSGFSRIAAELADLPGHPARHAAKSHKNAVEDWLTEKLKTAAVKDPAQLARQVMILIEGSMSLSLIHGNTQYIHSAGMAAARFVSGARS